MVLTKAWLPLGSEKKAITKAEKDKIEQYKKNPGSWPKGLWSFELWCAATGYDETKADGGPQFQTLMSMLLVENGGEKLELITNYEDEVSYEYPATHTERKLKFKMSITIGEISALIAKADQLSKAKGPSNKESPSYWYLTLFMQMKKGLSGVASNTLTHSKQPQKNGSTLLWEFKLKLQAQMDTSVYKKGLQGGLKEMTKKHGVQHTPVELETVYVHSPATQGEIESTEYPGITQGAIIGDTPNTQYKGANFRQHMTSVPRKVCSKLQWLLHTMSSIQVVQPKGGKKHSHSSEASFRTDGQGQSSCQEADGCMSTANLTAALFGLYYYEACRHNDRNWAVAQMIDGKQHVVRMRMYNPNYTLQNTRLQVKAKINSDYAKEYNHEMVGVDEGKLTLTPLKSAIKGTSKINSELLRVSEIMNT